MTQTDGEKQKGHESLLKKVMLYCCTQYVSVGPASEWGGCCFGRTSHLGPGSGGEITAANDRKVRPKPFCLLKNTSTYGPVNVPTHDFSSFRKVLEATHWILK